MNNLQKLIKLRGLTILSISHQIGHGYHMTQKVIKGTRYKRKDGSFGTYSSQPVESGVAAQLGLTHSQAWGQKSDLVLRRLINEEIKKQTRRREEDLRKQWLHSDRITKKPANGNV